MFRRLVLSVVFISAVISVMLPARGVFGQSETEAAKVYVPYDKLKDVFEKEGQGVFLSYSEFEKLWRAAQGKPADVVSRPFDYLISRAKFNGEISGELGVMNLKLVVDVLADGWVQVPVGLGEVAVDKVSVTDSADAKSKPLLHVSDGQYYVIINGKGRYELSIDFVRQLNIKPGLHVLNYKMPPSAMTTIELVIQEENMKVDVKPMLAATTTQVEIGGKKATKVKAFLSNSKEVELSWKPATEAGAELEPVVVCKQSQHINVGEAIVNYNAKLDYTIHRSGVDSFTVHLAGDFRVTEVSGANIAKWDVSPLKGVDVPMQVLSVRLFSDAKENYSLDIKMERFLQEAEAKIDLAAIVTQEAIRRSGIIGITHSNRRVVYLEDEKNLGRVDTGRLPEGISNREGATAWYFNTSDYGGRLVIETAVPRISVDQKWIVGVDTDRRYLSGKINYDVKRTGIFELEMGMPKGWDVQSVGPESIVDDFQVKEEEGERLLHVLLKREHTGGFDIQVSARAERKSPTEEVDFELPLADKSVQFYSGQVVLAVAEQLRAEVGEVEQLKSIPRHLTNSWNKMADLRPVMAYEFKAIDRDKPSGGKFRIAVRPAQVSAKVGRLVDIKPGSIMHEASISYQVRYAPVDTFYFKMPKELAEGTVNITGNNIKEHPRVDGESGDDGKWAYYKVVLHSKVMNHYFLQVVVNKPFKAGQSGKPESAEVYPILAAGDIAYQSGYVAVKKADRLAIGEPVMKNLIAGDPSSSRDVPDPSYRRGASLAFKYTKIPYSLSLPVVEQKEGSVFTTIADFVFVEQVVARDGLLNSRCMFLLATSQGDRLPVTLPEGAELTGVLLDGQEIQVEQGMSERERIIRLRPSAGEITRSVLEFAYTVREASSGELAALSLPEGIPVQQTVWRVWMPDEWYLLGHDRMFSRLTNHADDQMINNSRTKYGNNAAFKLSGEGKVYAFSRQGSADELSLVTMGKEMFTIILWVGIVLAGMIMLAFSGYVRLVVVVTAGLGLGVLNLYMPLLADRLCEAGIYSVMLVGLLWFGQWVLKVIPRGKRVNLEVEAEEDAEETDSGDENIESGEGKSQKHSVDAVCKSRKAAKAARDKFSEQESSKKPKEENKDDNEDKNDDKEGGR